MRRIFLSSFDRAFKKFTHTEQESVLVGIEKLLAALTERALLKGLGVKKLQGALWESRAGLHLRILFTLRNNEIIFAFVGSHDGIQHFLKQK